MVQRGFVMSKKQKNKSVSMSKGNRIAVIIIGAFLAVGSLLPVAMTLFGQTGYITEINSSERFGGAVGSGALPNTYEWHISYTFKTKDGKYETGSITAVGDAVSSKSGLRVGSPVRYFTLIPAYNTPGEGLYDNNAYMFLLVTAVGVWMVTLGARKGKPSKTPAQRSREYQAAKTSPPSVRTKPPSRVKAAQPINNSGGNKMFCGKCGTQLGADAKFCNNCGASQQAPVTEPDWDSFEYSDTPLTANEENRLAELATEEEWLEEFELNLDENVTNAAYCRRTLAIVEWRRSNGR
jgi:hypothetical protein